MRNLKNSILASALALVVAVPAFAQEKPNKEEKKSKDQESVESLIKQLKEVQKKLAKKGIPTSGAVEADPSLPDTSSGTKLFNESAPGTPGATAQYRKQLEDSIAKARAKIEVLTKKHGKDSKQVRQAKAELSRLESHRSLLNPNIGTPGISTGDPSGIPSADFAEYLKFMRANAAGAGTVAGGNPSTVASMGQRMVIRGLELQLEAVGRTVQQAQSDEAREQLTKQFKELAQQVINARQAFRKTRIKQIEQELAQLKKESENQPSVETLVKKYLKPKTAKKKEQPSKVSNAEKNTDTEKK